MLYDLRSAYNIRYFCYKDLMYFYVKYLFQEPMLFQSPDWISSFIKTDSLLVYFVIDIQMILRVNTFSIF